MQSAFEKKFSFDAEILLIFLLFLPLAFLFPASLGFLRPVLLIGLLAGGCICVLTGNSLHPLKKITSLVIHIAVLAWMLFRIYRSPLIYQEAMSICVQGLVMLIITVSAHADMRRSLRSLQLYAVILFLSLCALRQEQSLSFIAAGVSFVSLLLVTSRVGLQTSLSLGNQPRAGLNFANAPFVIIVFLTVCATWIASQRLALGRIKTQGVFKEKDMLWTKTQESSKEGQTGSFSDENFQDSLTKMIFRFSSTEEMHKGLSAVQDLLMEGRSYAAALDDAQKNLALMIADPQAALDEATQQELLELMGRYVERETAKRVTSTTEELYQALRDSRMGLLPRAGLNNSVHAMNSSETFAQLQSGQADFKSKINHSSLTQDEKEKLQALGSQLKDWKAHQLYRRKRDSLRTETVSWPEEGTKDLQGLLGDIDEMRSLSESQPIDSRLDQLGAPSSKAASRLLDETRSLLDLKKELLHSKALSEFTGALENANLPLNQRKDAQAKLKALQQSKDGQEAQKKAIELLEALEETGEFRLPQDSADMMQAKLEALAQEAAQAFTKRVRESDLDDFEEELSKYLRNLGSQERQNKITSSAKRLEMSLESLFRQGHIAQETKDLLVKDVRNLQGLLVAQSRLMQASLPQETRAESDQQDPQEQLSESLHEALQSGEQKMLMDKLLDALQAAQTLTQAQEAAEAAEKAIDMHIANKETAGELKELLGQVAGDKKLFLLGEKTSQLKMRLEALKRTSPRKAQLLEEKLAVLHKSKNSKEFSMRMRQLQEACESKESRKKPQQADVANELEATESVDSQLKIVSIQLVPSFAVLPEGSSLRIQSIAVQDRIIRNVASDLEWVSSDPSVASVDRSGLVHAVSTGEAQISAWFQGRPSRRCEITVVNAISSLEVAQVKEAVSRETQ